MFQTKDIYISMYFCLTKLYFLKFFHFWIFRNAIVIIPTNTKPQNFLFHEIKNLLLIKELLPQP